jgi:hypothetical protein
MSVTLLPAAFSFSDGDFLRKRVVFRRGIFSKMGTQFVGLLLALGLRAGLLL